MSTIKFGTDGWRAIIAQDFTVANVERVAHATALWLKKQHASPTVMVGHDCRFAGELFAETVVKIFSLHGIKSYLSKGFVSTPMISLGTVKLKANLGVIITASHNPPEYNGFKLKGNYGGPLLPAHVEEIEKLIPAVAPQSSSTVNMEELRKRKLLEMVDLETMYVKHVEENFDLALIRNSKLKLAYDAMYGAGQNVMRRILPDIFFMHCDYNPSFRGQAPEPIHRNLIEFSDHIRKSGNIDCGLVTDGDADRIGLYDSKGNFIDSHHIILLLIQYLHKYKGLNGKVCTAFSSTQKINQLCEHYGLPLDVVKIGFKYICEIMLKENVIVGGEESGGIAIAGHIPERDGIWIGLTLFEYMARTGKTIEELIAEIYALVGSFAFERSDLRLEEAVKDKIVANCKSGHYKSFGEYQVSRLDDLDGWKYFFDNGDWLMIRASGTEPVLRTYAESATQKQSFAILEAARKTLLEN